MKGPDVSQRQEEAGVGQDNLSPPTPDPIFPAVTTHQVAGKNAHDARLVAAMAVHAITHILTFNTGDFARYPGITVLDPNAVALPSP